MSSVKENEKKKRKVVKKASTEVAYYKNLFKQIDLKDSFSPSKKKTTVNEQLAERKRIENRGLDQDIALKKGTLIALFAFLAVETVAIFTLIYFQGFKLIILDDWSFRLLISCTILQITYMLRFAVMHLFPNK